MDILLKQLLVCLVLSLAVPPLTAQQTVYVTDELSVGLHEDKLPDSPVIKVVPSGTPLEIIKREEAISFVRGPEGTTGWIDNRYLMDRNPGASAPAAAQSRVRELQTQLDDARQQVRLLQAQAPREAPAPPPELQGLQQRNQELEQQLKQEKLRTGELQVGLSELRQRLGMDNEEQDLYREIKNLNQTTKQLQIQLNQARDNPGAGGAAAGPATPPAAMESDGLSGLTWRQFFIYLIITLVVGLIVGVYCMDAINRRRHGGFRV